MANIDKAITSIPIQHLTSPKLIVGSSSMPSHCHWRPAESSGRELGRVQVVLLQRLQPLHLSGVRYTFVSRFIQPLPPDTTDTMSSPSLLGLPPELRELILVALLVEVEPISLQQRFMEPAVSRVSRSLREEALNVLYHDNTFCIDNEGGLFEATRKLNSTLARVHPFNIARIRCLRLDWNTHCRANASACFGDQLEPQFHACHWDNTRWSAPLYMVACYLTLTTQEPWVELSVGFYENTLCKLAAKPLYEGTSAIVMPTLVGPLPVGQRRKQLTPIYFTKLVEAWHSLAGRVLAEKSEELHIQHLAAFGQPQNHALQDYQMQLMLREHQNKKRLLMARQDPDIAGFHPLSTYGANEDPSLQGSRTVSSAPIARVPSKAGKGPSKISKRKATSKAGAKRSRVTH
ncbi:hypothetical protein LTR29_003083 [Friedmanniomyces endolithicus]|nr:hypothetical protein LTR29_003083 [Friedmanniomyces endolithicus]